MKKIYVLIAVLGILGLSGYFFFTEGMMPVDKQDTKTKILVVQKGESLSSVANKLETEKLIRSRVVFYILAKQMNIETKIQAGDFRLSPSQSAREIAEQLTHGTLDEWVTIIEGLRKEEIAQILSKNFNIPESEFIRTAREGYLFPDTYLIPKDATAGSVIEILNNNFDKKFSMDLKAEAIQKKLPEKDVIILASLVEREARGDADRKIVAGILLKRWKKDWPLQIDATVQYALGYQPIEKTWWKKNLTEDDLKIDSDYNTYKNQGLPPAPICNPSLSSIKAVVEGDENTPYWFYLSDTKGVMHYSRTVEEHEANVERYLR